MPGRQFVQRARHVFDNEYLWLVEVEEAESFVLGFVKTMDIRKLV